MIKKSNQKIPIGKIICLARTYKNHAKEMNSKVPPTPLLFLKPESAVIFTNQSIRIPPQSSCLHHEVELGVVIQKTCAHVSQENALEYVLGYLIGLDITARDIQTEAKKQGWPWGIAKGFDTFAPLSDVVLKKEIPTPNNLDLLLKINGIVKQHSNTSKMTYSIEHIIEYVSHIMTLKTGDLIMTGTPEGVGPINEGDVLDAELESYCSLHVTVSK
ncbi:MAG: fumarylacetoacetate hydrolase family protein [Methanobacteriota archaeon]